MIGLKFLHHNNRFLALVRRSYFGGDKRQPGIRLRSQATNETPLFPFLHSASVGLLSLVF